MNPFAFQITILLILLLKCHFIKADSLFGQEHKLMENNNN